MLKQEVEFAVVTKNGAVTQIGKSQIYQPQTNFNGGEIKWFDDTKLIRKDSVDERIKNF